MLRGFLIGITMFMMCFSSCTALQSYVDRIKENPIEARKPICFAFQEICADTPDDEVCNTAIGLCNMVDFTLENLEALQNLADENNIPERPAPVE